MKKVLIRKQMLEVFSWVYRNRKSGKNRSARGVALYLLLYLAVFAAVGSMFYMAADSLCGPLVRVGFGWLYFALMGLASLLLGVFGSMFGTYTSLYQAKDNDLLLAMPIPPADILAARLAGIHAQGLLYELIVMLPVIIVWFQNADATMPGIICVLLIPPVLSFLVLVLSAALGWFVALVSKRMRHKNAAVVVLSLAVIGAYYYFMANASSLLGKILADPMELGKYVRGIFYPLYHMGLAAEGNISSMAIFTGIIAVLSGIAYLVLAKSFLHLSTSDRGTVKTRYRERKMKMRSVESALLAKEAGRFAGSSVYMLNCGLGIIFMTAGAIVLFLKADWIRGILAILPAGNEGVLYLIGTGAICMFCSMNDITAPSVSLEGKNLWILQVYPVSGRQVVMAKLRLHLFLTLIPAVLLTTGVEWVLRPSPVFALLMPAAAVIFTVYTAVFGLFIGLKMPDFTWTNEIVPIKQSAGVMIALFGSILTIAVFAGLYAAVRSFFPPLAYLVCSEAVLAAVSGILLVWLRGEGAEIFNISEVVPRFKRAVR